QTIKQARPMKKEDAEEVKTLVRRKFEELKDRQNKIIEAKEKEVEILNSMIDENGDGLDDRGMDQIMEHEGVRLNVYRCTSNKLTIGVGRNLEDRGITKEEAMYLFANDVRDFKTRLYKEIPWIEKLTVARQWVLINMAFNMGIAGLMKWKNTLSLIEKGRYKLAASMIKKSKSAKQVKERRYKPLCKQMETGDFV
ncbi:MAG: glycoside hydrolase family protein, partial [Melioribacteraceae bacterium]|nr:glycoside hydrolase family protein [Melioribacteraceae bacterium]